MPLPPAPRCHRVAWRLRRVVWFVPMRDSTCPFGCYRFELREQIEPAKIRVSQSFEAGQLATGFLIVLHFPCMLGMEQHRRGITLWVTREIGPLRLQSCR